MLARLLARARGKIRQDVGVRVRVSFPHYDPRVLHRPGECDRCDRQPHMQEMRVAWGVNFTGESFRYDTYGKEMLSDPATIARSIHRVETSTGNLRRRDGRYYFQGYNRRQAKDRKRS